MYKLRGPQLDALADQDLIRRIGEYLRERIPDTAAVIPSEDLKAVIAHGIEVARSYGLTYESSLANVVLDMLAVGPEFHLQPEIYAILSEPGLSEEDKLDRIVDDVSDAAWEEAGGRTEPALYWDGVIAQARAKR